MTGAPIENGSVLGTVLPDDRFVGSIMYKVLLSKYNDIKHSK